LKPGHFDPNVRENQPPAYFPNSSIPPQEPPPIAQTHGLDLSQYSKPVAEAYFKWLCANDAGDYIFKKVEGVDSVFEMRPRVTYDQSWPWVSRYYMEDPVGRFHVSANPNAWRPEVQPMYASPLGNFNKYRYWYDKGGHTRPYTQYFPEQSYAHFEMQARRIDQARYGAGRFVRFTRVWPTHPEYDRDENGNIRMFQDRKHLNINAAQVSKILRIEQLEESIYVEDLHFALLSRGRIPSNAEMSDQVRSRYGYTWRGISRSPYDRDLGIAGNEILVYDLKDNTLLGVRRSFAWSPLMLGKPQLLEPLWHLSKACSNEIGPFINKVLPRPNPYTHVREEDIQKY
jgi:hypothetical protein